MLHSVLSAIDQAVIAAVLGFLAIAIPNFVPKAMAALQAFEKRQHSVLLDLLVQQAAAYYKANEPTFEKQGIALADWAVSHVQSVLPGIPVAQVEAAVALFLQTIAKSA